MKQRATAILLVAMMVATGLSVSTSASTTEDAVPGVTCPGLATFPIAEGEAAAVSRTLEGNSQEIGMTEVLEGAEEILTVRLESPGDKLEWTVYHENNGECEKFDPSNCDRSITIQLEEQECTLDDPNSGLKAYAVEFANPESDSLQYSAWTSLS